MTTLAEIGEAEVIRRLIAARVAMVSGESAATAGVLVDAGDDAAVMRPSADHDLVATTDAFEEGRHYDPRWMAPEAVGARLATANLSDLAAMAAVPRWALLSAGARGDDSIDDWLGIQRGLCESLAQEGAVLCGGNLVSTAGRRWLSLTLIGEAERGRSWRRAGARAGDIIAVTGHPGRAGAGWRLVHAAGAPEHAASWTALLEAAFRPRARSRLALALASTPGVTAAIDLSDGFAADLARLAAASGVGAKVVDDDAWPGDPELDRAASHLGRAIDTLRFGPSDDYELVLAIEPGRWDTMVAIAREQEVPLSRVGRFTATPEEIVRIGSDGERRPIAAAGFDHFRAAPDDTR